MVKTVSRATKWILCTRWFLEKETKDGEKEKVYFWMPIGEFLQLKGNQNYHRVFEYDTQEAAEKDLTDIARIKHDAGKEIKDLKYSVCEVRYTPKKIKSYNQRWFDKYVIQEHGLKIVTSKDEEKNDDKE